MKKILIVKTSSLGDIIHAFPAVSYLHSKFPESQIDWVVEKPFRELVSSHPFINKTYPIHTSAWRKTFYRKQTVSEFLDFRRELREHEYDAVFDFQGNTKSAFVLSQVRSQHKIGFGKKTVFEWPNLLFTHHRYDPLPYQNVRDECLYLAKQFVQDDREQEKKICLKISESQSNQIKLILAKPEIQQGPKILVCPGSAWSNKQVTPEALIAFLIKVKDHLNCSFLFLWGSAIELKFAQELQKQFYECSVLVDKLSLQTLQNLMASVQLVIAMDSLPLHLAGTTDTPTFSVFGASSADKYKPKGDQHVAFQGVCPYGRRFERRCPILRTCSTGSCIRNLQGQEIFDYFKQNMPSRML